MENQLRYEEKDALCAQYVVSFLKAAADRIDYEPPLLLLDEEGHERFISTFICPVTVHHRYFQTEEAVIDFIVRLFSYKAPSSENKPESTNSLLSIVHNRAGTSMELCFLLCSLLLGLGFDAYCVISDVSEEIASLDTISLGESWCSDIISRAFPENVSSNSNISPKSKKMIPHCWLMIVKSKEEAYGIEVTTGQKFSIPNEHYSTSKIFLVFNHENAFLAPTEESLLNQEKWEAVFIGRDYETETLDSKKQVKNVREMAIEKSFESMVLKDSERSSFKKLESNLLQNSQDPSSTTSQSVEEMKKIVNLAGSFVCKDILREELREVAISTRLSRRKFEFKRSAIELVTGDTKCGLVAVRKEFMDEEKMIESKIDRRFEARGDRLNEEILLPLTNTLKEFYSSGRTDGLEYMIRRPGFERKLRFFEGIRKDGLLEHNEDFVNKTVEFIFSDVPGNQLGVKRIFLKLVATKDFNQRRQSLGAAQVQILRASLSRRDAGDEEIELMAEEFYRGEVEMLSYSLLEGKITSVGRRKRGSIIRTSQTWSKLKTEEKENANNISHSVSVEESSSSASGNNRSTKPKNTILERFVESEKKCFENVREVEREVQDVISSLKEEKMNIRVELEFSEMAKIFSEKKSKRLAEEESKRRKTELEEEKYEKSLDLFLDRGSLYTAHDKEMLMKAREDCLVAYKELLVSRGERMEKTLMEEKSRFESRKQVFERSREQSENGVDASVEEDFEKYKKQTELRIEVLEQRAKDQETSSLKRFRVFDEKLRRDPRLSSIFPR